MVASMELTEKQIETIKRKWGRECPGTVGRCCFPRLNGRQVREAAKAIGLPDYRYGDCTRRPRKASQAFNARPIDGGFFEIAPGHIMGAHSYEIFARAAE
jgi:hypothetical protein